MAEREAHEERRAPRGVIVIAVLLIVVVFFSAAIGTLVPSDALAAAQLTRPLLWSFALVTGILAYGLLRLRRWAWFATLSFVVVQAYFVLLQAALDGTNQLIGLALLAAVAIYLLIPSVRRVFLDPAGAGDNFPASDR